MSKEIPNVLRPKTKMQTHFLRVGVDMHPPLLRAVESIYSICEASSEVQLLLLYMA